MIVVVRCAYGGRVNRNSHKHRLFVSWNLFSELPLGSFISRNESWPHFLYLITMISFYPVVHTFFFFALRFFFAILPHCIIAFPHRLFICLYAFLKFQPLQYRPIRISWCNNIRMKNYLPPTSTCENMFYQDRALSVLCHNVDLNQPFCLPCPLLFSISRPEAHIC